MNASKKPPMWERDPERYAEKAKARIKKHSVVNPETGCWQWTGALRGHGSGSRQVKRPKMGFAENPNCLAYRVAYELWVGPIPEGLGIDHLCENVLCVCPDHLEPVTVQENIKRYHERRRARERQLRVEARERFFGLGDAS